MVGGALIAERLRSLPEVLGASTLLAYWAFGSEVDLSPFLSGLDAVVIALPRVIGPDIIPVSYHVGDPLEKTSLGPQEPMFGERIDPSDIEAVLTPGIAFDRSGGRLGYGGGYYDRFFSTLDPSVPRIGVAFSAQLVEAVPRGRGDRPVDLIVTEEEIIRPA